MKKNKGIALILLIIIIIIIAVCVVFTVFAFSKGDKKSINNQLNENNIIKEEKKELISFSKLEIDEDGFLINDNYNAKINDKEMITIPVGFAICETDDKGNATIVKDINKLEELIIENINDGIIIVDKNENEFIWIPVEENSYNRNINYSKTAISRSCL